MFVCGVACLCGCLCAGLLSCCGAVLVTRWCVVVFFVCLIDMFRVCGCLLACLCVCLFVCLFV